MSEKRQESGWPIGVGVLMLLLVALAVYVGGYFAMSKGEEIDFGDSRPFLIATRTFNYRWQVIAYTPLVRIESLIRGRAVAIQLDHPADGQ